LKEYKRVQMMQAQPLTRAVLGQYFTSEIVSRLLVDTMGTGDPRLMLDLGMGAGTLSIAALNRWRRAKLIGVDIDASIKIVSKGSRGDISKRHSVIRADALGVDIDRRLPATVDAVVCNPPFRVLPWKKHYARILEEAGLRLSKDPKHLPAEIAFIAQNLRFLKTGGEAGFILPASLVSGEKHIEFREALLREFTIGSVIQLGSSAFSGTEARAHIVTLSKKRPSGNTIELMRFNRAGGLTRPFSISLGDAAMRMDYEYFSASRIRSQCEHHVRLGSVIDSLTRGKLSSREIREEKAVTFHLGDFVAAKSTNLVLKGTLGLESRRSNQAVARPGDILVGRIGRNIDKQVAVVISGQAILSDCIYRIRCAPEWQQKILAGLSSTRGRILIRAALRGSAAQFLSKADLLDLTI
jgi:type I restriction enzyme M protein